MICHFKQPKGCIVASIFQNHPHYYTKNSPPKSSDICHLPRRWAVLSIPPFQTAAAESRTGCAPLSLQVWATVSRIFYGNVRAYPGGFAGSRAAVLDPFYERTQPGTFCLLKPATFDVETDQKLINYGTYLR